MLCDVALIAAERATLEPTLQDDCDLALIVLALPGYSSGAFSIGSNRSASSPSRFQDCSMCGGKGAETSMTPPRGCGITMRRASKCSRFCRPPGSSQFSLLKYFGSPTLAWSIWAIC